MKNEGVFDSNGELTEEFKAGLSQILNENVDRKVQERIEEMMREAQAAHKRNLELVIDHLTEEHGRKIKDLERRYVSESGNQEKELTEAFAESIDVLKEDFDKAKEAGYQEFTELMAERVDSYIKKLESQVEDRAMEIVDETEIKPILETVAKEWLKNNEASVKSNHVSHIGVALIQDFKRLVERYNFDIPETLDINDELEGRIESLEEQVIRQIKKNKHYEELLAEEKEKRMLAERQIVQKDSVDRRKEILDTLIEDLPKTTQIKVRALARTIPDYDITDDDGELIEEEYEEKLEAIVESVGVRDDRISHSNDTYLKEGRGTGTKTRHQQQLDIMRKFVR